MFSIGLDIDKLYLALLCKSGYWLMVKSKPLPPLGREEDGPTAVTYLHTGSGACQLCILPQQ